jgi:hypothetical protein
MREDDVRLVKQLVKETVYGILESEFYNELFGLLDAVEGGIAMFEQQLRH